MKGKSFFLFVVFALAYGAQGQTPAGPALAPAFPDSVYLNAEMLVGEKAYDAYPRVRLHDVTVRGWNDDGQGGNGGYGATSWLYENFGLLNAAPSPSPGRCYWGGRGWQYGNFCLRPRALFQVEVEDSAFAGLVLTETGVSVAQDPSRASLNPWEKFVEGAKLIIDEDTLLFSQGTHCKNLPGDPLLPIPPDQNRIREGDIPRSWSCWKMDRMLFATDDILSIQIRAQILYDLPTMSGEVRTWQHRTTRGSKVKGTAWLSWRIPISDGIRTAVPDPMDQLRLEKKQGIRYEYKVLRDGNKQWITLPIEETEKGAVEEVRTLFGTLYYQRRKYLVTGLDPDGEYSFCIRAFNATGRSEEVCNLDVITPVAVESGELPGAVHLSQNYPNPFNPSTTITYTLPRSGPVELSVYDLTGRIVETLVEGVRPAGSHTVRFEAHGLPSGTYVYRFRTGTEILTRLMTVLR